MKEKKRACINNNIKLIGLLMVFSSLFFISSIAFAQSDVTNGAQVDTTHAGSSTKVAPGEFLPISIKLSNFGGGKRVDVLVSYGIFDKNGEKIYSSDETVAVETTANYVKKIQIPQSAKGGVYIARTSITYLGQVVPATTSFPFSVEVKILGIFQSDFLLYGGITLLVSILLVMFGYSLVRRRRQNRFHVFDYSNIPHDMRTFYEILSDTILGMRERAGDDALSIAANIDGLEIDSETGRVLSLTGPPSRIIAKLVSEYEVLLGKKVSFVFRPKETSTTNL